MKIKILIGWSIFFIILICFTDMFPGKIQKNDFNPGTIKEKVVLVLSPHLDDSALPMGGMLSKEEGRKVVMTFFSGSPSKTEHTHWDRISGFTSSGEAIKTRTKENQNAMAFLNSENINVGLEDFQYRSPKDETELPSKVKKAIEDELLKLKDYDVFVYAPAYFGKKMTHPDHKLVHDAFVKIFLEKKYQAHFYMFEDMPYYIQYKQSSSVSLLDFLLYEHPEIYFKEEKYSLLKENVSRKLESIKFYTSQVRAFDTISHGKSFLKLLENFIQKRCGIKTSCEVFYELSQKI